MAYEVIGSNNGTGDGSLPTQSVDRELFFKKLSTDVLRYFQSTNIAKALVTNRSIDSGKSEAFPVVGNSTAQEIANDASELDIRSIKSTEREIAIGNMTVAHSWITDLDSAMVHYDAKAAHTESIGRSLATLVDKRVIAEVIAASGIVDAATASTYGLRDFDDDIYTQPTDILIADVADGAKVYQAMASMNVEYVDKDIVGSPVYLLRPQSYFSLLNNPANTGLTWVNDPFAMSGKVPQVLGRTVMTSPHFPAYTGVAGAPVAGETVGLLFSKESVGVLELLSISMRSDYIPLRLANLMVGKLALGYGVLNHGCAIGMNAA